MPVAGQRDPEDTRATLVDWLSRRMPDARDIAVPELVVPQSSGFSNETFLFDATWSEDGAPREAQLVLRAQPQEFGLFPNIDVIRQQFETMRCLGEHTDVPVPKVRWAEENPEVLGQPFFVMDRITGQVPADNPPYTSGGFVIDLSPADRRALHESGLEAMTRVHRVDWRAVGLDFLDRPEHGAAGPEQLRNYFEHYYHWAQEGKPHPVCDAAWQWLDGHWPDDGEYLDMTWGDARLGNLMFQGTRCVAVFDWEMAAIANAESDLGWWLFMQRFHTEGHGVPLPEGLLGRRELIERWERKVGRPATHIDFYEVLGGFHFSVIMIMLGKNMLRLAPDTAPPDFGLVNPGPQLLAKMLGLG